MPADVISLNTPAVCTLLEAEMRLLIDKFLWQYSAFSQAAQLRTHAR